MPASGLFFFFFSVFKIFDQYLAETGKLNLTCVHGIKYIESCNLIYILLFMLNANENTFLVLFHVMLDLYVGESRC